MVTIWVKTEDVYQVCHESLVQLQLRSMIKSSGHYVANGVYYYSRIQ